MAREQVGTAPSRSDDAATLSWVLSRIAPSVVTITSSSTPEFNTDVCNCLDITNLVTNITDMSSHMSGTPVNFQKLMVRIYSVAAQTISWGNVFTGSGMARLPSVTQPGKTVQIGLEFNAAKGLWVCLAADSSGY